jgi:hypothetical protein
MFGREERPLTLMLKSSMPVTNNATVKQFTSIPEDVKQHSQKMRIDLVLAHARFVRPSRALLAASSAEVWNYLTIRMSPDSDCISCWISTIKATAKIKDQSTSRSFGMPSKSSKSVITSLNIFAAEHRLIRGFTFWGIEKIKSDADTEFTSQEFENFCADKRVAVSFAPPKHQEGNHFAERTWQSLSAHWCMLGFLMCTSIMLCFIHALCSISCFLRIW